MTKELSKIIGSSRLSFATGEDPGQLLGVQPGSASVLGLLNDTEHRVMLVLDRAVAESRMVRLPSLPQHQLPAAADRGRAGEVLPHTGHVPLVVEL